jgi:spore germination protein PC
MYYNEWQNYYNTIESMLKNQNRRIQQLELQVKDMEEKLQSVQDEKKTNIEKIEYHFDQLKIDTLEGTLNIGLSPQGLSTTEELSIPTPTTGHQQPSHGQNQVSQEMLNEFQGYFNNELRSKINEFAREYEKSFPPGFENMILQDVYKQLPERIDHYMRLHSENSNGLINDQTKQVVMEDVKNEIIHSVRKFMEGKQGG